MMLNGEWSPCWIWIGAVVTSRNGTKYGKMSTTRFKRGPRKGKKRYELPHRVVLKVFKGRVLRSRAKGMHLCNYSLCCAPDHLVGGTQRKNIRQAVKEGRHKPGTANQYGTYK